MTARIGTLAEIRPDRAKRYPEKAQWVCIYIPRGSNPIRRVIGPPGPESERVAAEVIAELTRREVGDAAGLAPLFSECVESYLDTGVKLHRLAGSTLRVQRGRVLALGKRWGHLRIDQITAQELVRWWEDHVLRGDLDTETGRRWLSALSSVFRYSAQKGVPLLNPVRQFLPTISAGTGTKAARSTLEDTANPIEQGEELLALEEAVSAKGDADVALIVLLMLDEGARRGEVFAARPMDMSLGDDANDVRRLCWVRKNRPGSAPPESPKSGRIRAVPMSRRLRAHLREHYALWPRERTLLDRFSAAARKRARKKDPQHVDGAEFFQRTVFPDLLKRAGLPPTRVPKDLRDTFASHLLTAGFPGTQIMRWLGHAPGSVAMFRRRYAKWIGDENEWSYRPPVQLASGEVPPDLLARLSSTARAARENASG